MRRVAIYGALTAAFAACSCALSRATEAISRMAIAVVLCAIRAVAETFTFRTPLGSALAVDGPALAYDAPSPHYLRHEAGISRRAAARHT